MEREGNKGDYSATEVFPAELVLSFFAYLEPADLCRAGSTCRGWYQLSQEESLWKALYLRLPDSDRSVSDGFKEKALVIYKMKGRKLSNVLRAEYRSVALAPKKKKKRKAIHIKLTVVGDSFVGKTSALCTFENRNNKRWRWTDRPSYFDVAITPMTVDNIEIDLGLWDTAAQEDYDRLRPLGYQNTNVFMLCFSINNRRSFDSIKKQWVLEATGKSTYIYWKEHPIDMPFILVGTKTDLYSEPEQNKDCVTEEEAIALAHEIGALGYYPCSAKCMIGLNEAFEGAVRAAIYEVKGSPTYDQGEAGKRCVLQ